MENKNKKGIVYFIGFLLIIIIIIILLLTRCSKKEHGYIDPTNNSNNTNNTNNNKNVKDNKDNNIDNNSNQDKNDLDNNDKKVNKDIDIVPSDSKNINKSTASKNSNNTSKNDVISNSNNDSSTNISNSNTSSGNEINNENNNSENQNNNGNNNSENQNNDGELIVDWQHTSSLDIFYNTYFNDVKIAPGISGNYSFEITNGRGNKIGYNISFNDTNIYNINMKYRLKKDNTYVVGDDNTWVSINELFYNNQVLNINQSAYFILEWIWEDSDNDTEIGKTMGANYSLNITVYGEDIND